MAERTRILLVEDERIIARGIQRCVERLGYELSASVGSGEEALVQARQQPPDLVLLDINLGSGLDGIDTALRMREFLDVPIVFLTAHSDTFTLDRAKQAQPSGFVLKPYDDDDLRTAIEIGIHRYKAEREVRISERWLGSTLDSIGDGVIATGPDGKVRLLNGAAEAITGWSVGEAFGLEIEEVLSLTDETSGKILKNPIREALIKDQTVYLKGSTLLRTKSGELRYIEDSAAPIHGETGISGAIMVFRDVSERHALESKLELKRAQLERTNLELEELNRRKNFILGMVAHDLRNPLSVVQGYALFLQQRLAASGDQAALKFLKNIQVSAEFTLQLVEDLLDVAALESGQLNLQLEPIDLVDFVDRIVSTNAPLFESKGISICHSCHSQSEPCHRAVDRRKLEQVLMNLLTNALKYSPPETVVSVTTSRQGNEFVISIEDQGQGIAAEEIGNLFQVFGTTSNRTTGGERSTGLGLAIAYKIVQGHGGRIEVESQPGIGSVFRVVFPVQIS